MAAFTGIVGSLRSDREYLLELDPKPLNETKDYLDVVSRQWSNTLARLKRFVEG